MRTEQIHMGPSCFQGSLTMDVIIYQKSGQLKYVLNILVDMLRLGCKNNHMRWIHYFDYNLALAYILILANYINHDGCKIRCLISVLFYFIGIELSRFNALICNGAKSEGLKVKINED